jgi:hypothetical protein
MRIAFRRTIAGILRLSSAAAGLVRGQTMKAISKGVFGASLLLALVMSGVAAQAAGHKGQQQSADKSSTDKPKADEKAYAQALSAVPNKTYDPWHGVR